MSASHLSSVAIQELTQNVSDLIEVLEIGDAVTRVEMGTMADGSYRPFALVHTIDQNELEQEFRVSLAASEMAPAWAPREDRVEVRVGDSWTEI